MRKRNGKFYYRNESETMERLGLKQTAGSGNGWVSKEDGENEHVLCQLKSTDKDSIRIKKLDVDKLLYHAYVSHKLPVFAVQFLETDEIFLLVRPDDLPGVAEYLDTGHISDIGGAVPEPTRNAGIKKRSVRSSPAGRSEWYSDKKQKMSEKGVKRAWT